MNRIIAALIRGVAVAALVTLPMAAARAAASASEQAQLGATLTPLGAEKAGNADHTIPAWTGGYSTVSPGYAAGAPRPDPFAAEQPVLTITADTAKRYAGKLSTGTQALFEKYPGSFKVQVYPTHRTAAAPQWVYDNTRRNATQAQTSEGGLVLHGAFGGVPFPVPHDAMEVMWNDLLPWKGEAVDGGPLNFLVTRDGTRDLTTGGRQIIQFNYYKQDGSPADFDGYYSDTIAIVDQPELVAGQNALVRDHVDQLNVGSNAWIYLPGQRRTRRAPQLNYDTPLAQTGGIVNSDEFYIFSGAMDRYKWQLLGKREMYVPYNDNDILAAPIEDALGPHHPNPARWRWELHRVWEVAATLAPGKRNVIARRKLYLDEDTWQAVLGEGYDASGKLWKVYFALPYLMPDLPAVAVYPFGAFDLLAGSYAVVNMTNGARVQYAVTRPHPPRFFTPEGLLTVSQR